MRICYLFILGLTMVFDIHCTNEYKKFLIIIPSYNNAEWYKKNLDSVCTQDYQNYSIVYVDDCSTDNTGDLVEAYIKENAWDTKVTFIRNTVRQGALANIYTAVHAAPHNEIIVLVDGDDWLQNKNVLSTLNNAYQNPDVWFTYGQFYSSRGYPGGGHPYPENIITERSYRKNIFRATHLRTFYAWLFKLIKKEDLMYEGAFFAMAWDLAIMYPLLEMSNGRFKCIRDTLYIYNNQNPLNDNRVNAQLQQKLDRYISSLPPYAPLLDTIGQS